MLWRLVDEFHGRRAPYREMGIRERSYDCASASMILAQPPAHR